MHRLFPIRALLTTATLLLAVACSPFARAQTFVQFTATFDFGTLSAPDQAKFQATINSALNFYSTTFTTPTPLNVSILFMADESVSLGQSSTFVNTVSYTNFRAALVTNSGSSSDTTALSLLPIQTNNPVNSSPNLSISTPLIRALGLSGGTTGGEPDSTVSLKTSIMNLDRTTIDPAKYDLKSTVWHEVNEVLGFGSALNNLNNGDPTPTGAIGSLDLFRYTTGNLSTRSFTTDLNAGASFSINGTTALTGFNQTQGGDFHDFIGGTQVQNAFGSPGTTPNMGTAELTALDVVGYNLSGVPEPQTYALFAGLASLGWVAIQRRRRAKTR